MRICQIWQVCFHWPCNTSFLNMNKLSVPLINWMSSIQKHIQFYYDFTPVSSVNKCEVVRRKCFVKGACKESLTNAGWSSLFPPYFTLAPLLQCMTKTQLILIIRASTTIPHSGRPFFSIGALRECPNHGSLLHRWTLYRCWMSRMVNGLAFLWPSHMYKKGKMKVAFYHVISTSIWRNDCIS